MTIFVWKMHREASEHLGTVRTQAGLEVCAKGDTVWIRCEDPSEALHRTFMQLPAVHSIATDDGQLIQRGTRVPRGYIADGPWLPIAQWMKVTLPVASLGGVSPLPLPIDMVHGETFETPRFLQTDIQAWTKYAVSAPRVRLDQFAFAATANGTVFVRGEPLPPLTGKRFIWQGRIAVEAGWSWRPDIAVEVLEAALAIESDHLAVMYGDGRWLSLTEESFVQATRSAVRTTSEGLGYVC